MEIWTTGGDPQADLWDDPAFIQAHLDAVARDHALQAATDAAVDSRHATPNPYAADPVGDCDPATPQRDLVGAATDLAQQARASAARLDDHLRTVLADAAADPVPWVGPDPTLDPDWEHPAGWSHARVRARRRDLAVRSAAADLGVRLALTDHQIRGRAHHADLLATRCPRIWAACLSGGVSEQNARTVALFAAALPDRASTTDPAPDCWAVFDDALTEPATSQAPGRFRTRARVTFDRVHPDGPDARHTRARQDRNVTFYPDLDGMYGLEARLPATKGRQAERRVETLARHLARQPGETRTLAQLRADVLADLLTGAGTPDAVKTIVHLTIPALTLLQEEGQGGGGPATLDGYGPIDLPTARDLIGDADAQWLRVLTHPIDGTIIDLERRVYRTPKSLKRWVRLTHPTCPFPGCTRTSHDSDTDHRVRWADGGRTNLDNLNPPCPPHHPVKDETAWTLSSRPPNPSRRGPAAPPGTDLTWTTPTGMIVDAEPPPF